MMRVSDRATAPRLRLQAQQAVYPTLSTFFVLDDGCVSLQQGNEISPCLQTNAMLGATRLRCGVDAHVVILGCTLAKRNDQLMLILSHKRRLIISPRCIPPRPFSPLRVMLASSSVIKW